MNNSIGNIFVDKAKIHEQCTTDSGQYEASSDILSRPLLLGSSYTELNSYCFLFEQDIIQPMVDMEKLWEITGAERSASYRLVMYLQMPGCFTPLHVDWMQTYSQNVEQEDLGRRKRWWIGVDNWILGQCLMHSEYTVTHFKSGDVFPLNFNEEHVGVNASLEPRYYITFSALVK